MNLQDHLTINFDAIQQIYDRLVKERPAIMMDLYLSERDGKTMCATACCILGWGMEWKIDTTPEIDDGWEQLKIHLRLQGLRNVGATYADRIVYSSSNILADYVFEWLFGGRNSNDLDFALARLEYLIKHKTIPLYCRSRESNLIAHMNRIQTLQEYADNYDGDLTSFVHSLYEV